MFESQKKIMGLLKEINDKKPDDMHIVNYLHDLEPREALLVRVMNLDYQLFYGGWHYWKEQGFWSESNETNWDLGKLYQFSKWEPFKKICSMIPNAVKLLGAEPKPDSDEEYDRWSDRMNELDDMFTDLLLENEEKFYDLILEYYEKNP